MEEKKLFITLVSWLPWFYKSSFFRVWGMDHINLSHLFWKEIFKPDFFLQEIKKANKKVDIEELKYISKNSLKVYKNLIDIRNKKVWIEKIIFSFVLIHKLINYLSSYFLQVKFFDQFWLLEEEFIKEENFENNIIYNFLSILSKKEIISNYKHIVFRIDTLDQLYQIKMIDKLFFNWKLQEKKIYYFIWDIIEFESKSFFNTFIKKYEFTENYEKVFFTKEELFTYFNLENYFTDSKEIKYLKIMWETRPSFFLFSWKCEWWKCVFCNYWYNEAKRQSYWNKKEIVQKFLDNIEKFNIKNISILDPSITMEEMLILADEVIYRWLQLTFQVKTRFSEEFTLENCKKLKKAWIIFLWVWLESASPRVNTFMNKYSKPYNKKDFNIMLNNCNKAELKVHHYGILWFPTETRKEANITIKYLLDNIRRKDLDFYSYTIWFFWVSKWTYIYNNPEKYNIEIDKNTLKILEYDFKDNNKWGYTKQEYYRLIRKLDKEHFFSFSNFEELSKEFWYFVEKSFIFHFQRIVYNKNPYLEFSRKNDSVILDNIFDNNYKIAENIQIIKKDNKIVARNWLSWYELIIDDNIRMILKNYDNTKNLLENFWNNDKEKYRELLFDMIKKYFFIKN